MEEIGIKLREKREQNGVSIEEAAEDLKMRPSQIRNLEEGKKDSFKDTLFLKYFIRDYAKYLGLDEEKILDEFNEYLFDFTSKIPVDKIEEAINKKTDQKVTIASPYTMEKKKMKLPLMLVFIVIGLIIIFVSYLLISTISVNHFIDNDKNYAIGGSYE